MGKKGGWLSAVRKAFVFNNHSKDKKEKKPQKTFSKKTFSKKSWFGKQKNSRTESSKAESAFANPEILSPPPEPNKDLNFAKSEPESSKPKEPENEPIKPTEPDNEPSKPNEPENGPIEPTEPDNESSKPKEPENRPTEPTEPDNESSKPKEPENGPIKPTEPDNERSNPREPENKLSKPEIEQKKPVKTENEHQKPASTITYPTSSATVTEATSRQFLGKSKEEVAAIKVQTAFRRYSARKKFQSLKGLVRLKVLIQSQMVNRQSVTTLRCMQRLARVQSQVRARRIRMSEENQSLQRHLIQKHERELDKMKSSLGNEWDNSRRSKEQIEASLFHKEDAAARRERALAYAQTQQEMWRNPSKSANPTFMDPNNPQWGWSWLDRWMAARPWESQIPVPNDPQTVNITRSSSLGDMTKIPDQSPLSPSTKRAAPSSPKNINGRALPPRTRRHSISDSSSPCDESSSPRVVSQPLTKTKSMNPTTGKGHSTGRSLSPSPLGPAKKGTTVKKQAVKRRSSLSGAPPKIGSGFR